MTPATDSLPALAAALRSGALEPAAYLDTLERRCAEREPEIRALVEEADRFERLRRESASLLAAHASRRARPPLFGVPVGFKDVFRVDGFPTRAGSRLPPEELAGPEAESVTRLREAGALVLGKTVSTEFAFFAPGPTRNPRNPAHTPGGSSSGSAAAVAAGFCPLALGTQTYGSISRPAAYCSVVGYKPSYDRISRRGVVPLSPSLDHVGTFTVDASGAAAAAALLCRHWRFDAPAPPHPRLAVPDGPYLEQASAAAREHFARACAALEAAGFRLARRPAMPDIAAIAARHDELAAAEAARVHAPWYDRYPDRYHERLREFIERGAEIPSHQLEAARSGRRALRDQLTALMETDGIDLWITPAATGPAPAGLESTGDPAMSVPWTHAGLPTVTLPAGTDEEGLPLGLQLAGGWYRDEELLGWGAAIEAALRRSPGR